MSDGDSTLSASVCHSFLCWHVVSHTLIVVCAFATIFFFFLKITRMALSHLKHQKEFLNTRLSWNVFKWFWFLSQWHMYLFWCSLSGDASKCRGSGNSSISLRCLKNSKALQRIFFKLQCVHSHLYWPSLQQVLHATPVQWSRRCATKHKVVG